MAETSGGPVVHLERSRTSRAFDSPESLWAAELEQIYGLIDKHVAALAAEPQRREDDQDSRDRLPLLSIAIFGTSGSGKTSLLKTLHSEINRSRYHKRIRWSGEKSPSLRSLPIIEPNILANDEHFLYAFLAAALDEDLKQEPKRERTANALTPLQQEFQNVSEYLQVIDKVERPVENDPLGLSLERLDRHSSGLLLRQKMWTLLDRLADDLAGRDRDAPSVLLLPVDDADMAFDSLISTLDTFHRYLLHPRLIPIFTFTGRLAEELLRVHFARNLTVTESRTIVAEGDQTPTTLRMAEHLAVQYLVKLFPIRNRVRLGPAPARVQAARYQTQSEPVTGHPQEHVWDLLEAASILLFGDPEWPIAPRLRLALRPSTLRRQLQVLDAMHDSRVSELVSKNQGLKTRSSGTEMSWVSIFDNAAWALLNVHRDVLREFRLHIEELYNLTPHNLSREVLDAILSLDWDIRRELIQRWRFQVEDRRGQVLSLLALNAFRPQMPGEEPSGDDPDAVRVRSQRSQPEPNERSFSATKGLIWFLNLWTGFYLPQILARNRLKKDPGERPEEGGIRSVGWNLRSGPANAIQEAIDNHEISATGMMLLHPEHFKTKMSDETHLALHIWCFYGYKWGKPWIAVSFWRGLGLIGLLLEDHERLKVDPDWQSRNDQLDRIKAVLEKHCATAKLPGSFQEGHQPLGSWNLEQGDVRVRLEELAREIKKWLQQTEQRIFPLLTIPNREGKGMAFFREAFQKSFIRRLHGDYLLGGLWPELGGAYVEGPPVQSNGPQGDWNAQAALCKWSEVLTGYWDSSCQESGHLQAQLPIREILLDCPLLQPFLSTANERKHDAVKNDFQKLGRTDKRNVPWEPKDANGAQTATADPGNEQ